MKKALIALWVCSFLILLTCVAVLSNDSRNTSTCEKLEVLSSINNFEATNQHKGYALRFPVH
jgi:hypothetical protein